MSNPVALRKALVIIAFFAVVLGVFFRCYHVDRKVYGGDEIYSSLRILGDVESTLVRDAPHIHDVRDLLAILHPAQPAGANGSFAVVRALASEEPHQAPLYFELGHAWASLFGNSIAAIRSMSVVAGILALPCAFWFGVELYRKKSAGWIALALFALSPVLVAYSQQAREYALWTTLVLASGAATLRALRLNRARPWWLAAVLLTLALYADPLTLPVAAGFAASVVLTRRHEQTVLIRWACAYGGALLAFLPWLVLIALKFGAIEHSLGSELDAKLSLLEILRIFAGSLKVGFIDLGFFSSSTLGIAWTTIVLIAVIYSLVFVLRNEPRERWLFLVLPIVLSTVPFMLLDLLFSGQRTRQTRYFMACYMFVDYLVVGVLVTKMSVASKARAWLWCGALCALLLVRVVSCAVSSSAFTWWSTQWDNSIAVAHVVNQSRAPVVVSDDYLLYTLVLANYLRPDIKIVVRPRCYECVDRVSPRITGEMLPDSRFSDAFAVGPSPQLQQFLSTWAASPNVGAVYHCVNARHNCTSDLNIEPVFTSSIEIRRRKPYQ